MADVIQKGKKIKSQIKAETKMKKEKNIKKT